MKLSYLRDNFEALVRIKKKARHIYADALCDQAGEFKGVLVIDAFTEESPFNETVRNNMSYYLKILGTTL